MTRPETDPVEPKAPVPLERRESALKRGAGWKVIAFDESHAEDRDAAEPLDRAIPNGCSPAPRLISCWRAFGRDCARRLRRLLPEASLLSVQI